jgi:dTDP-N-acetylfucosamine:lipid II N-acetylfucosaminyltransferase
MVDKKIIHIFHDDKFIDPAIKLFESVCPNISEYYILKEENVPFQYVTSKLVKRLDFSNREIKNTFIVNLNSSTKHVLFLHALDYQKQEIVLKCNPQVKKVWFIWGYDLYYNWELFNRSIYEAETRKNISIKSGLKQYLIFNTVSFFLFKKKKITFFLPSRLKNILDYNYNTFFYKSAQLIDIVVPIVPNEFELIKKMNLKAKLASFTYGCIEDLLGDKINSHVLGQPNILIGNSADPSNNHLDIFYKLSKLDLQNKKVYVPLSYGGNENYKLKVIEIGTQLFGDKFHPLTDFMSLVDYNNILLSCGTLIFNHIRQQGVGNIIIMGHLGAKIFLNKKSPVYKYYKELGLCIYDNNSLDNNLLNDKIKSNQYQTNKNLLFDLYSKKNVHDKIRNLISIVDSLNKFDE